MRVFGRLGATSQGRKRNWWECNKLGRVLQGRLGLAGGYTLMWQTYRSSSLLRHWWSHVDSCGRCWKVDNRAGKAESRCGPVAVVAAFEAGHGNPIPVGVLDADGAQSVEIVMNELQDFFESFARIAKQFA